MKTLRAIALLISVFLSCPALSFAAGITVPAGSILDVNDCTMNVCGDVTNAGTLAVNAGTITLIGSWINSGTFSAGTNSTVTFNAAAGIQTLDTGGVANAFYNLTHSTASTLSVTPNLLDINGSLTNSNGTFTTNNLNLTVGKDWNNTAVYNGGTTTVTFDGTLQTVYGESTFYNFTKDVSATAADTLTFQDNAGSVNGQLVTNMLILKGAAGKVLSIRSTLDGTKAKLKLYSPTGAQSMQYLNVKDSDASGGMLLNAGLTSTGTAGTYENWSFGAVTLVWDGDVSTDWDNPFNWDLGIVPAPGDTVTVADTSAGTNRFPVLSTDVNVGTLTIAANATMTLNGKNLTVGVTAPAPAGAFNNNGTLKLFGLETITFQGTAAMDTDSGTFTYTGNGNSAATAYSITNWGSPDYFNLTIASTDAGDTFTASAIDLDVNGSFTVSSGTFTAPGSSNTFTVAGNFTGGSGFSANSGTVTLDAANGVTQLVSGSTTFYRLAKSVTGASTLQFANTATQTVTNNLSLSGASSQLLSLRSDSGGTSFVLILSLGGTQALNYLDVQDADACSGGTAPGSPPVCSGTGLLLVARNSQQGAGTNNDNWQFGAATLTWTGSGTNGVCGGASTANYWNCQQNWDMGVVPIAGDAAVVANAGNQPALLTTAVNVGNLTVNASATVSLNGQNLTVTGTLDNSGTLKLFGSETVAIGTTDTNSGTFEYNGNGDGTADTHDIAAKITVTTPADNTFYNVTIADTNGTPDTFSIGAASLTVGGTLTVSAGTFTGVNGTIDASHVTMSGTGILIAPSSTSNVSAFNVSGNWSRASSATFTHSSGQVIFDGTAQNLTGDTSFELLRKVVQVAGESLTFEAGKTQTIHGRIVLTGESGKKLNLLSSSAGSPAYLNLQAGGLQSISYAQVKDNNASGLFLVDRNATLAADDLGGNTNWGFGSATVTWYGDTDTDWDTAANWNLGLVPISGDSVVIPDNSARSTPRYPVLASNVTLDGLTLQAAVSTLTLNGRNLSVDNASDTATLLNDGVIILIGSETLAMDVNDTDSGTFRYVGNGDGATDNYAIKDISNLTPSAADTIDYFNLVILDPANKDNFATTANLKVAGALTVTGGTLDTSAANNDLIVEGVFTVNGGTYTGTNSAIDANSNVAISSGTFTAPSENANTDFTIAGNFSLSPGATFNNSTGRVTFNTTNTATISGDATFYDLAATTDSGGAKEVDFQAGSTTTVQGTFDLQGYSDNLVTLRSTVSGTQWLINVPSNQYVNRLDVRDSNASNATVTCLNCVGSSANNTNWIFSNLSFVAPLSSKTIGLAPVFVGQGPPGAVIVIRAGGTNSAPILATAVADSSGYYLVVTGSDDAATGQSITTALTAGAGQTLRPFIALTTVGGDASTGMTAVAVPNADQVPTITSPANNARVNGNQPAIIGQGLKAQTVTIMAKNTAGGLGGTFLLQNVGTGTVDNNAATAYDAYSVTLSTALLKGVNYVVVLVDGVASDRLTISLTDPFGVVFDSTSNKLIKNASVAIYRVSDGQLAENSGCDNNGNITTLRDIACDDTNPYITSNDGFYSFLTKESVTGYHIRVSATGYTYESKLTTFPAGRTIVLGSKAEDFPVGTLVIEMDHPVDANGYLLRIEKDANKSQVRVGDVITYTIKIENLSSDNAVNNFLIDDRIPPGFKYLPNRVLLDGLPLADPFGQRPLLFSIDTIAPGATRTLRYQLVIGAGVSAGKYDNLAVARYTNNVIISNNATKTVSVVPDPLFDMGTVIGKVFFDWNENGVQDAPEFDATEQETVIEKPVPNVQIVTEDGMVITTDRDGKFSVPGLMPGRHILRVDERTLPQGSFLTTDKAVIINVTPGSLVKANFGVNIDNQQIVGADAQFFDEKIKMTQNRDRPVPRLNVTMFDPSLAAPLADAMTFFEGVPLRQAEFRIFTNYAPFIESWNLDIIDADTKKLIKRLEGSRFNLQDPVFFNGRDSEEKIIAVDRNYAYVLKVFDGKGVIDETGERPIKIRALQDMEAYKTETEETVERLAALKEAYDQWFKASSVGNALSGQNIRVQGETLRIDRQGMQIKTVRVMKEGHLIAEIPLGAQETLSARALMEGRAETLQPDNVEVILPDGDYTLEVIAPSAVGLSGGEEAVGGVAIPAGAGVPSAQGEASSPQGTAPLARYTRALKVGDDYFMFVALGDAQVGYNINRGNIEPVQSDPRYQSGFYSEGKGAYYLKGKVKGKYLVTSSFDSQREQKELFRKLDPETYYPIYGDSSSVNYDATNTKGPLYLLVEWDKSSVIWGNYAVDFKDTEFATFSRAYYGGKMDYQSLAVNPYGDTRTKVVVFHAEVQERPAHNEFLGTGGSLYFLKHKGIVLGSDKIMLEVRDKITGLVISSREMKNGADYELDEGEGRILFWQPVAMIAKAVSIVSDGLLDGNPIYVVADYQYEIKDMIKESSEGARVAQAVGDHVVVGGTYVKETQALNDYTLKGMDTLVHLGPDAKVKAEYAQTASQNTGTFVSTDGGITFTELNVGNIANGVAYGLTGDARLFDRIGLTSYYRWVENSFATNDTLSQQGKESAGMALTFDLTPVTRLTARRDIQRLINNGNLQVQAQVGASETTTTMVQIVHESDRLKLTGAYEIKDVKEKIGDLVTATNQVTKTFAGKAEYALTGRVNLSLGQQFDLNDPNQLITTIGADVRVTDQLTLRGTEVFSPLGATTSFGATANVTGKIALMTDYAVLRKSGGGIDKTTTVGAQSAFNDNVSVNASLAMTEGSTGERSSVTTVGTQGKLNDNVSVDASVAMTEASTGEKTSVATVASTAKAKLTDNTDVAATIGLVSNEKGQQHSTVSVGGTTQVNQDSSVKTALSLNTDAEGEQVKSLAVDAIKQVDDKTSKTSTVKVDEDAFGARTATVAFADTSRLNNELQAVSQRSFVFNADGSTSKDTKYVLSRDKDGKKTEASLDRKQSSGAAEVSQSNIFGLSGDVNDKVALQAGIEKGEAQNLDGTRTNRTAYTLGMGYVLKDTETAVERLKNSTKIELRLDDSVENKRQFVFYNVLEGKINDNLSLLAKLDYSRTENVTTNKIEERHKEIVLGAAYRPVNVDNLNLIARYTYKEGQSPAGQVDSAGVERSRMQVFAAEAVYDLDENWQLAEKFAFRINDEQISGFEFNRTHTWLMVQRVNYKVDPDWTIGGEYRRLTQVEAKDSKQGVLLEAIRTIGDNAQLGIGWNFTQFSDDLTNLNYTSQGPFLRMTGKLYDRTPAEKARARAKWLNQRVTEWAWILVKKEIEKKGSPVVEELNRMFFIARSSQEAGRHEQAQQIYKDIITAGQMMFDEASEYIRTKIAQEEKLQEYSKTAEEYFKGGDYEKAGKIWEKVVEDASKGMLK